MAMTQRHATRLETLSVDLPEDAVEAYESAFHAVCNTVGLFLVDEDLRLWRVEGVKAAGEHESELAGALALAGLVTGVVATPHRRDTPAEGWLARIDSSFPEQRVGHRFAIRGTHLPPATTPGRMTLVLDAGVAFGSGEHESTRGCLLALERVAHRRPCRVLDLGTGSGILAMAAARLLHRPVLATDIDPWAVRTARSNMGLNALHRRVRVVQANGWSSHTVRAHEPYDLVFANILARPLCAMAQDLALHLAPGGTAILAGLLTRQVRMVLSAHRRQGLTLDYRIDEKPWSTLILRKKATP
jgi:ribosomal protein L11 methyltransferase